MLYAGEWQMRGRNSSEVDTVEVKSKGFTGDQGRKRAVPVPMKRHGEKEGEIVDFGGADGRVWVGLDVRSEKSTKLVLRRWQTPGSTRFRVGSCSEIACPIRGRHGQFRNTRQEAWRAGVPDRDRGPEWVGGTERVRPKKRLCLWFRNG